MTCDLIAHGLTEKRIKSKGANHEDILYSEDVGDKDQEWIAIWVQKLYLVVDSSQSNLIISPMYSEIQ